MRGSRPHNPNAKYVIVDDIYFYKEADSGYYLGNVKIPGRKRRYPMRLHVYIWRKYNGDIPKGYHVHHKDENKDNNDISNLELLKSYDHLSSHALKHSELSSLNMYEKVLPAAKEWHKSEKSTQFHKDHYEKYTRGKWMEPVTKTCTICGKEYTVTHASAYKSKYCSNACKATARRRSGKDNIEATCQICGKTYIKNKYSKSTACKECNIIRIGQLNRKD